jgi:hypothetical protein
MFGLFGMGFPTKINKDFDWSQIGPKTKSILEKYSINPVKHTVYSGLLQYNEIEDNYPLTIQEKIDMNVEQLQFIYKLQEGERQMQSHVDNLASNPYFHYHIQLDNVPTYFIMLQKQREKDIEYVKSYIAELEELLWEDEEFVSQFNKD